MSTLCAAERIAAGICAGCIALECLVVASCYLYFRRHP